MGTLTEITAQANYSIMRRSPSTLGYQCLQASTDMEKENPSKSNSPHFMSPTLSSAKQMALSKSAKSESNNAWMKSAAKRVGFRRGGNGAPRSKKEEISKPSKAISFPDKVCL